MTARRYTIDDESGIEFIRSDNGPGPAIAVPGSMWLDEGLPGVWYMGKAGWFLGATSGTLLDLLLKDKDDTWIQRAERMTVDEYKGLTAR
jgi:hypothetical protein